LPQEKRLLLFPQQSGFLGEFSVTAAHHWRLVDIDRLMP